MRVKFSRFIPLAAALAAMSFMRLPAPAPGTAWESRSEFLSSFPLEIGGWTGQDSPVDEKTMQILETRNVLSREYAGPGGARLHLLMVGSDRDRRVAHPPEVCYTGSNYIILEGTDEAIKTPAGEVPVRRFRALEERNPNHFEEVIYFYLVGGRFTSNYYAQQVRFAFDRLSRRDSSVLLIRAAGPDRAALKEFLSLLIPLLPQSAA